MRWLLIFALTILLGGPLATGCLAPAGDRSAWCGDGVCEGGESQQTCASDCADGRCGNHVCEAGESPLTCAADCPAELCGNRYCDQGETVSSCPVDCAPTEQVDLLFVVDNSGSMAYEQAGLRQQFAALHEALADTWGALPDVHVGVTSTDVGAGGHNIQYCQLPDADAGALLTGACADPQGAPYLVDVAPAGCEVARDAEGRCLGDDCQQHHCAEGQLVTDPATGCPRCRNYPGLATDAVFDCMASLGTLGCGFEQPLEAMRLALDHHPANTGFLREDSILVVILVTDEDDCSARSGLTLFDPTAPAESSYGPLTSYRCFEQGVVCDVNDRVTPGTRHHCRPREDPDALVTPVSEYVAFLRGLRDPGRLVVAAIAGEWDGDSVEIGFDDRGYAVVQPTCFGAGGGAVPGVRLKSFVEQLHLPGALPPWAYGSVCDPEGYDVLLSEVGARVGEVMR